MHSVCRPICSPFSGGTNDEQPRLPTVLEEKQDNSPLHTDQLNVPIVPDSGSSRSSQSDLPHDQEPRNKRIVDITENPGNGAGAPYRISDPPSLTDQAVKSMDSQTGRSDKAKLTPGPVLENSRSGDTDSVEQQRPSQQEQHKPPPAQQQHHFQNNRVVTDRSVTLRRNVASVACGAKLLESSPSMKNAEAVLNSNNDEYMNVPCSSEKWFVLEVCEPVQLRTVELANYELFSSRVKSFNVFVSDRCVLLLPYAKSSCIP
ncbi:SUN domain-containing ossification factor [Fasciolopsis buskii]|uniref:SUN domain-containing ossification factor n=1 Tax=Fasciolopsis buskii TaxID=27845 RepID=A0A8E0RUY5_9TREM|nr:SUN domain-containing ossification factor [Fasciolopsis buski]